MAKAVRKTTATEVGVADFIAAVPDARRREEAEVLDALHRKITGCEPKMWGPSIIGYGSYDYKYESGREGTMCRAGFSPRKGAHVLYGLGGLTEEPAATELFARLGKHSTGKGCLYVKRLADVDLTALEALAALCWERSRAQYPD